MVCFVNAYDTSMGKFYTSPRLGTRVMGSDILCSLMCEGYYSSSIDVDFHNL